jgi:hypothetical protein
MILLDVHHQQLNGKREIYSFQLLVHDGGIVVG